MTDELWIPSRTDFYPAILRRTFPERGFVVAELSNGESVWVNERALTFGGPGKHCYCLPLGTEMSVRIERQTDHTFPYRAIEAQIAADTNEPVSREEVTVERWTRLPSGQYKCGGVRRSCGCGLFARFNSGHVGEALQPGDTILVDVAFSEERGDFMGTVVEEEF
jgi:hypothetical protein